MIRRGRRRLRRAARSPPTAADPAHTNGEPARAQARGVLAMVVLPASFRIDLKSLEEEAEVKRAELASEEQFRDAFPECETGAMPPFGNLYGLKVLADEALTRDKEIVFNACSHRELIRMTWADYQRLAKPKILRFAARHSAEAA